LKVYLFYSRVNALGMQSQMERWKEREFLMYVLSHRAETNYRPVPAVSEGRETGTDEEVQAKQSVYSKAQSGKRVIFYTRRTE
jgi:hypothetical protein